MIFEKYITFAMKEFTEIKKDSCQDKDALFDARFPLYMYHFAPFKFLDIKRLIEHRCDFKVVKEQLLRSLFGYIIVL